MTVLVSEKSLHYFEDSCQIVWRFYIANDSLLGQTTWSLQCFFFSF